MYLCSFDRQGIIRSDGISIIAKFPRFLVCLLAFHHVSVDRCGVPCHANIFSEKHTTFGDTKLLSPLAENTERKHQPISESHATSELELIHDEMAHTPKITIPKIQRPLKVDPVEIHCAFFSDKSEPSLFNI